MSSELTRRQVLGGLLTLPAYRLRLFAPPPKLFKRAVALAAVAAIQAIGTVTSGRSGIYTDTYGDVY
jgi:hypothetical protein